METVPGAAARHRGGQVRAERTPCVRNSLDDSMRL